jgi:hypothetical protein
MRADETLRDKTVRARLARSGRKHVRLDPPYDTQATAGAPEAPSRESSRLLDRLRKAILAARSDRRDMVRHDVVDHDIWVGWWSGEHFGAVLGRLENLSRGGALAVLGDRPPRKQPIWLYREVGSTLAFVRGEVAGVRPSPGGAFAVRFRFAAPCPTELCQATICGRGRPRGAGQGRAGGAGDQT